MSECSIIIKEFMDQLADCMSPEVARCIVEFRASPEADAMVQDLGEKCNDGTLTAAQLAEYANIVRFVKFVSILQSKARKLINDTSP